MYPNCGTYAGYRKHHNQKTKPCIECLVANRVYSNIRYKKDGPARQAKSRANNLDKIRARERAKSRRRRANQSIPYNELQVIATYGGNCNICGLAIDFMAQNAFRICSLPDYRMLMINYPTLCLKVTQSMFERSIY